MRAAVPAVLGLAAWLVDMDGRVGYLESTSVTKEQAHRSHADLLHEVEERYPMAWLRGSLTRMEAQLGRLEERVENVRQRLQEVERELKAKRSR